MYTCPVNVFQRYNGTEYNSLEPSGSVLACASMLFLLDKACGTDILSCL